ASSLDRVLRDAVDRTWNQASLMRGRERTSSDRAISRAGRLGEGAQARLSEVAKFTGCFIFLAHCLDLLKGGRPRIRRDHRVLPASFKSCQTRKLSKFRPERIVEKLRFLRFLMQRCQHM